MGSKLLGKPFAFLPLLALLRAKRRGDDDGEGETCLE